MGGKMDKPPTVLVVEDTEIAREPLVKLLRKEGFETISATNGQEALDALPIHQPDLILLDIIMPVMNGLEFLSTIRADPSWNKVPVIVLTAVRDEVCERDVLNLGVQGFVLKSGYSIDELLGLIRRQMPQ
jgi:CheY-like chemotaxis protein